MTHDRLHDCHNHWGKEEGAEGVGSNYAFAKTKVTGN